MIRALQAEIIRKLWDAYLPSVSDYNKISSHAKKGFAINMDALGVNNYNATLDHMAIIDLTGPNCGISYLRKIFNILGLQELGSGYLPNKHNSFIWMSDPQNFAYAPNSALPQVIVADFEQDQMSRATQSILNKYAAQADPLDLQALERSVLEIKQGDLSQVPMVAKETISHLHSRGWAIPTSIEYETVKEENELAAWALIFGRRVNHFGIGVYTHPNVSSLAEFNQHLQNNLGVVMNAAGDGVIKGSKASGIEQSSNLGHAIQVQFGDGKLGAVRGSFMEFVWRHSGKTSPMVLKDYYTDFIAGNANGVIESIYKDAKSEGFLQ